MFTNSLYLAFQIIRFHLFFPYFSSLVSNRFYIFPHFYLSTVYHIDNLFSILLLISKNVASVPPQLNPRYRILYITKNPPLQGTLERSVLSDCIEVAYVPLPAEGSASVPPCPNPGLKSIKLGTRIVRKGTLERSVLSDRLLVAYVPLPAEGSASVPYRTILVPVLYNFISDEYHSESHLPIFVVLRIFLRRA